MSNIYNNEDFFKAYANMERSKKGLEAAGEWHQLQHLFPCVKDKKVLDLGCGYGWHCKYAISQGAKEVLGLDLSDKMIETAIKDNADPRIKYMVSGLDSFDYPQEYYDLVISNLVLHYIENLDDIYSKVYSTLKDDGVFLLNIEHPMFTAGVNQDWIYDENNKPLYWPIDNYFYVGERTTNFLNHKVTKQHHTLTQIINGLLKVGFKIEVVEEAKPSDEMLKIEGMKDELRRPMMLLIKVRK